MSTQAVIPVKPLDRALRRLSGVLDGPSRRALQAAMLTDLLVTCAATRQIARTIVVTNDASAAALARRLGADVIADHDPPLGINAAVARGLQGLVGPAIVLMADLALARPHDLDMVISEALPSPGATLVPSRDGTGTNVMLLDPPGILEPHLGPGSLRLHLQQAQRLDVAVRVLELAALSLDVDTPEDLALLCRSDVPDGETLRECRALGVVSRASAHAR